MLVASGAGSGSAGRSSTEVLAAGAGEPVLAESVETGSAGVPVALCSSSGAVPFVSASPEAPASGETAAGVSPSVVSAPATCSSELSESSSEGSGSGAVKMSPTTSMICAFEMAPSRTISAGVEVVSRMVELSPMRAGPPSR